MSLVVVGLVIAGVAQQLPTGYGDVLVLMAGMWLRDDDDCDDDDDVHCCCMAIDVTMEEIFCDDSSTASLFL